MYYYLHGLIALHTKDSVVIECGGVGYEVLVSHPDDFTIGENIFIYTSLIRNENDEYLVGFKTLAEKKMYSALTSVKGIGPKTALAALANTSPERLALAIDNADDVFLMRLPGLGKKNASQIILDLKGKLTMIDSTDNYTLSKNMDIAYKALKDMGFKDREIKEVFLKINDKDLSVEDYLKKSLSMLGQ